MASQVVIEYKAELGKIKAQMKELEKNLKGAEDQAKKTDEQVDKINKTGGIMQNQMKKLGAAIAAAFAFEKVVQFAKAAIDAASDLNETLSKTQQIFGDSGADIERWSRTSAQALGQSQTQAMEAASTFAIMGKAAGLTGGELVKFSTDFVALASDLASFNNTSPEEAIQAIGAALRGESEPIRRYGVLLNEATLRQEALALGIISTIKEALTPQQRALAAQAAIYKQTADSQGDFQRTSDGLANSQRILTAEFTNLKAALGQELIPVANETIRVLNEMAKMTLFLLNGIDKSEQAQIDAAYATEQASIAANKAMIQRMADEGRLDELRQHFGKRNIEILGDVMTEELAYEAILIKRKKELEEQQERYAKLAETLGANYLGQLDYNVLLGITEEELAAVNKAIEEFIKGLNDSGDATVSSVRTLKSMQEEIKALQDQLMQTEIGTEAFYALQQQIEDLQAEYKKLTTTQSEREESMRKLNEAMADSLRTERDYQFELDDTKRLLGEVLTFEDALYNSRDKLRQKNEQNRQKDFDDFEEQAGRELALMQQRMDEARQMYINLGMSEQEYTEHSIKLMERRAAALLAEGALTQEQYDKIIAMQRNLLQQTSDNAMNVSMALLEGMSAISGAMINLFMNTNEAGAASGDFAKHLALFNLGVQSAEAIGAAIVAAFKNPLNLTLFQQIAQVTASVALVLNNIGRAKQLLSAEAPQPPQFAEGGWVGGKSHADGGTMIEAEKGEFIINRRDAAANKDILKAINTGNLSKYVVRHYVEPLTRSLAADKNSLAENIAASLAEQMTSQNSYLRKISKGRVEITNAEAIARALRTSNINRFKV